MREDPVRKGLLFAGSERAVYVSFDDGEHWQSLRLNMPATSIRDLVIKVDDIVVGTHGRSFWILDNISALRQVAKSNTGSQLYKPQTATRIRWNMNTDTPLPQEEPAGQNPPDGAMIDYYLAEDATGEVTLEISDAAGKVIRRHSSNDKPYTLPADNTPPYWIRPQQILSGKKGSHRFLWDMHYAPLEGQIGFPIAATYHNTAPDFTSPWVMPGNYTAKLNANGQQWTQTFTVRLDPRVTTSKKQLQLQHDLSLQCYTNILACKQMMQANAGNNTRINDLQKLQRSFQSLMNTLQDADVPPTTQMIAEVKEAIKQFENIRKTSQTN